MNSSSSCGEGAAVRRREERLSGINRTKSPLHDHDKMPFPCTLSSLLSVSLSVVLSSKVFYLLLHQPESQGCSGMTHQEGGTHTVNQCVLLCVYKIDPLRPGKQFRIVSVFE